uniref:Uncharacterized protein n=1 Tax=Rhizophora mucronata TaxID=61149 RepID=A0A2P2QS16_RHIMU
MLLVMALKMELAVMYNNLINFVKWHRSA